MSRQVHLTEDFLLYIEESFRQERGPEGEPSIQDFFLIDLDTIVSLFAERWDSLPRWQQHSKYRDQMISGKIAYMYYVIGEEQPDGSISLVHFEVDDNWPESEPT